MCFWVVGIEPCIPFRAFKDNNLAVMDGSDIRPGSVVRSVKASPWPSGMGRHKPAKQNHSSPVLVNFHFDFGDFVPVNSKKWEAGTRGGAFIGQHGLWNRAELAGYKVVFVPFIGGRPVGEMEDFLTGFICADDPNTVYGRPCGLMVLAEDRCWWPTMGLRGPA